MAIRVLNTGMCDLESVQLGFTFVRVISKPRMDVTIMMPTSMKEMCWDQNFTYLDLKKDFIRTEMKRKSDFILVSKNTIK